MDLNWSNLLACSHCPASAMFGSLFETSSKMAMASDASSAPNKAKASLQPDTAAWLYSLSSQLLTAHILIYIYYIYIYDMRREISRF